MFFIQPQILIEIDNEGELSFLKGNVSELKKLGATKRNNQYSISGHKSISRQEFEKNVIAIKQHIFEGDVYEVNYSYAHEFEFEGDAFSLYQQMRNREKFLLLPIFSLRGLMFAAHLLNDF